MAMPITLPITRAVRLEYVTIGWMIVEGGLSVYAGIAAGSLSLVAFGADSFIELVAGGILLWRLERERKRRSIEDVKQAERIAAWVAAFALAGLCLYIVGEAAYGLLNRETTESSPLGIAVAVAALIIMIPLASTKRSLAAELKSAALRSDAACSITCAYMAAALLIGLVVGALTGWWWVDAVISLLFLVWLIPETREALEGARHGELRCKCD